MNLLELMLKEEVEWPAGAEFAAQSVKAEIIFCKYGFVEPAVSLAGTWRSVAGAIVTAIQSTTGRADDFFERIITREEYQAAGGKIAAPSDEAASSSSADNAATAKHQSVDATLTERGNRYGKFKDHAELSQKLKEAMYCSDGWECLSADMREALEMIQHKVARILNGDPTYADSWHDIAGYAKLVDDRLNGVER